MKKTLLSACMLCLSAVAMAQPAGGFGGFQAPQVKLETSQEWKDVNYAGDDKAYHYRHPEALYIDVGQVYGENDDVYAQRQEQARHQKFCIEFANIFKVFHSNYPTYTLKICLSALFL